MLSHGLGLEIAGVVRSTPQHADPAVTQVTGPAKRPSPLVLPRVTRAHLQLGESPQLAIESADLLSHVAGALAPELDADLSMQARLLSWSKRPQAQVPLTSCIAEIELAFCEEPVLLEMELDFAVALVSRLAGDSAKPGPVTSLTRLEEAALGYLLLVGLRPVRSLAGWPASLVPRLSALKGGGSRVGDRGPSIAVEVELSFGAHRGQIRCWVPSVALQRAWSHLKAPPSRELGGALRDLELPVCCRLAPFELDVAELRSLAPRDVLIFGTRLQQASGRISTSTFDLTGEFTPNGFEVTSVHPHPFIPDPLEPTMIETLLQSPHPPSTESLRVELEVELTRRRLTLGQLAGLTPGAILPLQLSISEPVTLRVGERVVGTAELVDIEGEVGARILTLVR